MLTTNQKIDAIFKRHHQLQDWIKVLNIIIIFFTVER